MDLRLGGRRAFISGSTQGIGFAIARALLAEGVAVVINGRTAGGVRDAVGRLRADTPDAVVDGIAADFGDPEQVTRLLDALGEVDILVNNVGLFDVTPFAEVGDDEWRRYFEVNVLSGVRLARQLLPGMLERDRGRILFVASESGVDVPADMVHYGVTKAAMLALGNGLAKSTRGTSVTVNTILGGPTYSDGVARVVESIAAAQGMPAADLKAAIAAGNGTSLVGRFLEPAELAVLAVYLASPLSSATNGAALRADGGKLTGLL